MELESLDQNKESEERMFSSFKDYLMYYHTSIRNVALYTTVSFAALGYSRFYREKSKMYNILLISASIIILSIAALLNLYLYNHNQEYLDLDEFKDLEKWNNLNKMLFVLHTILLVLSLYTFYRNLVGNKF